MLTNYLTAMAEITGPGELYETTPVRVGEIDYVGFVNAPETLLEVYRAGLQFAEHDFYVFQNERYSFADTWKLAARVANTLLAAGVTPGECIGIASRNYPEWIFAFMGITAIGGVATALNAWWSQEETLLAIRDSGLKYLIVDAERYAKIQQHIGEMSLEVITVRMPPQDDATSWNSWIADAATKMPELDIAPLSPATLLFTSGSTAHPKGVLSSHLSIVSALLGWEAGAIINWRAMQLDLEARGLDASELPDPRKRFGGPQTSQELENPPASILSVPLFHCTGLAVQMLTSFRGGRKLVGMYKWDVDEALRIIQDEKLTSFNGVPTMSWELTQSPNLHKYDLSSLHSAGGGGAPMAPEHSKQIDEKLCKSGQLTGWGMTETQGYATNISGREFAERPRSCGRAIPPICKVKAVDEDGNDVGPGNEGELSIWGIMSFTGYWNDPKATATTMPDGWVRSGDLGYVDEDGYVFITDRKKDIVIRGGENISCQEVESVLYEHGDILECAVFGIPDVRLGEIVGAVVHVEKDSRVSLEEIQEWARGNLAAFQIPEKMWLVHERLPRTGSEKIFKRVIRKKILEELGLVDSER